jgi:formylmethanofuran dehydrogenase subunit E
MFNQNILKINFAGDITLANNIYNHFISSNSIINEKVKLEEDNIIIFINREYDKNEIKQIRSLLQEYLNSFIIYKKHQIFELGNVFTIGIPKDIVEISKLVFCEICGYGLSNEEELLVHRRSHGII